MQLELTMKIIGIDIYKFPIPTEPFVIATGTLTTAQNMYIKIHTDEGIDGVGECSAFPMIVGETLETCYAIAQDFAKILIGKNPLEIEARMSELDQYCYRNYTAKSAFDIALYDIAARTTELPLYKYLHGKKRILETDMTVSIGEPTLMAKKAAQYVEKGFKTIKIKVAADGKKDIERLKAIRDTIGNNANLRIDANQGWNYEEALHALTNMAQYDIEFCEQPMRTWDDEKLPNLVAQSPIDIMADESVYTCHDADRIIRQKACKSINIKFAKSGGILGGTQIASLAKENEIPCMIGGMLESRIAMTAKAHFACSNDNIKYLDLDTALLGHLIDPVIGGAHYNINKIEFGETLGLGVDADPVFLKKQDHIFIR